MASATMRERLTAHFLRDYHYPSEPTGEQKSEAALSACRVAEILRGFVSELEADASSHKSWHRADALGELWEEFGR